MSDDNHYRALAEEFERYGQFFLAQAKNVADGNFDSKGEPIIIEDGLFGKLASQAATNLTLAGFCRTLSEINDGQRTKSGTSMRRGMRSDAGHSEVGRPFRATVPTASKRNQGLVLRHEPGHDDRISPRQDAGNHPKVIPASPFILCPRCSEPISITKTSPDVNFALVISHFIIAHPEVSSVWQAFQSSKHPARAKQP